MKGVKKSILNGAEMFSFGLNILMLVFLLVIIVGVTGLLFKDIYTYFVSGFEYSVSALLGSFLVLWVLLELMHTQLEYLKGGKIDVSIFILVALMAFVRKLMVSALEPDALEKSNYLLPAISVLGVLYVLLKVIEYLRSRLEVQGGS